MTEYVKKITPEKKEAILQNSVMSMPNAAVGNPSELKKAFVNPIINADGNACLADEIDRIAQETNEALEKQVSKDGDTMTGSLTLVTKDGSIKLSAELGAVEVTGKTEFIGTEGFSDFSTAKYGPGSIKLRTTAVDVDGELYPSKEIEVLLPTLPGHLARIEDIKLAEEAVRPKPIIIELILDHDTYNLAAVLYESGSDKPMSISRVDLPLEEMVVDGRFDDATDSVILTLKNGNEVEFSVAQLVNGLVSSADFQEFVLQKGQANGFPSLDENGKVPKAQLPSDIGGSVDGVNLEELKKVFVEKPTNTTGFNRAYGVLNGSTTTTYYDVMTPTQFNSESNAKRRAGLAYYTNGRLGCAIPEGDYEAANKKFVEDAIAKTHEILDLAGVTETIETTSTYDVRNTAEVGDATLKVLPGPGTKVTKVEGNGATSENMLNIEAIDQSLLARYNIENGEITIKAISGAPNPVPITLGKFSDLIPTAKVGDVLYINATDSAGAISGDVINVGQNWTVNGMDALTVVAGILDLNVQINFANTGTAKSISKLIVSKKYNPTFIPYYNGLKIPTFNGITSSSKNLWDNSVNSWTKGTATETSTGNVQHFSNWINIPVGVERFATSINGVGAKMRIESVKVGNNEYKYGGATGEVWINLATVGYYGITAIKLSTYLPPDTNLAEITTQIEIGDTVTDYVQHESSSFVFPAIEMPLGRVLDFENKKVKDYGVDIVFKGDESEVQVVTENINSGSNVHSMFFPVMSISINEYDYDRDSYICTDTTEFIDMRVPVWHGLADSIGITAAGESLTQEQLNLATINLKAWLAERYQNGNPVTIRYISSKLQSERDMTEEELAAGNTYMPIVGGIEYQSGNIEAAYGANNTVTQEYDMYRKLGGDN